MKTITTWVQENIIQKPFLIESLQLGIINFSALAELLQKESELELRRKVTIGSIIMALRRFNSNQGLLSHTSIEKAIHHLGDFTIKSNLTDYNFQNSTALFQNQIKILEYTFAEKDTYYAFIKGIYESNLIISSKLETKIYDLFSSEKINKKITNLNSLTIQLPPENERIIGLYYVILKQLAWEGISIYEVVSTTNEFTLIIDNEYIDKAFSVVKNIKT